MNFVMRYKYQLLLLAGVIFLGYAYTKKMFPFKGMMTAKEAATDKSTDSVEVSVPSKPAGEISKDLLNSTSLGKVKIMKAVG